MFNTKNPRHEKNFIPTFSWRCTFLLWEMEPQELQFKFTLADEHTDRLISIRCRRQTIDGQAFSFSSLKGKRVLDCEYRF